MLNDVNLGRYPAQKNGPSSPLSLGEYGSRGKFVVPLHVIRWQPKVLLLSVTCPRSDVTLRHPCYRRGEEGVEEHDDDNRRQAKLDNEFSFRHRLLHIHSFPTLPPTPHNTWFPNRAIPRTSRLASLRTLRLSPSYQKAHGPWSCEEEVKGE